MSSKMNSVKKWVNLKQIRINVIRTTDYGVYCRIYGVYKKLEYDMFPLNVDFFVSVDGNLILSSNENLKIKTTIE
jgi:hypothetical protein